MDWNYIDRNLHNLLEVFKQHFTDTEYQNIKISIEYGEEGLALETICEVLNCVALEIPSKNYSKIVELGEKMKINEKYWKDLKVE